MEHEKRSVLQASVPRLQSIATEWWYSICTPEIVSKSYAHRENGGGGIECTIAVASIFCFEEFAWGIYFRSLAGDLQLAKLSLNFVSK